ncbi:hypothetical protein [Paenibacillus methanolicus]|uniref:Uncharacterized protein n=1 Tax=Paenibacillus methanolicus TaxID=582686 RepID=A0A5S5CF05_9BACL|nr:hypothetical protein [Paenibacillus methanolicus]TYP77719.1 hypothetical protein BCM02_102282 [Paenibacillus methanolicus]
MRIKVVPTVMTAVLSASLLVGGWYAYRNVATVQPLEQIVNEVPGVTAATPVVGRENVTVQLTLKPDANIRKVYDTIAEKGDTVIGDRTLELQIENKQADETLNDIWSAKLFDIAQAMENRQYAQIPAAMAAIEQEYKGVTATSEMDDKNVYITLKDGEAVKHVILPRTPNQLGVWPNA